VTAAEHYTSAVVINQHGFAQDTPWLASPLVTAAALTVGALVVAPGFITLRRGAGR
jgi:hypothetical protein